MSRVNLLSIPRPGLHAWRLLVGALLCLISLSASAAPRTLDQIWSDHSCGSCHGTPAQWNVGMLNAFATGRSWTISTSTQPFTFTGTACTKPDAADPGASFKCWFTQFASKEAAQMGAFDAFIQSSSDPQGDAAQDAKTMGKYILNLLQGSVTPGSVDFGNRLADSAVPPQTITVENYRALSVSYQLPSSSGPFSAGNSSCSQGVVPAATLFVPGSCTFDVTFAPLSSDPATLGPKTPSLSLAFQGGGSQPPGQVYWDSPTSSYKVAPAPIALSGTGYRIPTAVIDAISPAAAGSNVSLNGGNSNNPNGAFATLLYKWHITGPGISADTTGSNPTFTTGAAGAYSAQLTVYDGYAIEPPQGAVTPQRTSLSFTVVTAPTASLTVQPAAAPYYIGATITFDASASTVQQGHTPIYHWEISPAPGGTAWQSDPTLPKAYFTPPDTRPYTVTFSIEDQGVRTYWPVVPINPKNTMTPGVDPGRDSTVAVNTTVHLNGSGSTSNGIVKCTWSVVRLGPNTPLDDVTMTVTNQTLCTSATFVPSVAGSYRATLKIDDGFNSASKYITITASNGEITVVPFADQSVLSGTTVTLTASATSNIGDQLGYAWSLGAAPDGNGAGVRVDPATPNVATLTPIVPGQYRVVVTINDQHSHSVPTTATIDVQSPLTSSTPVMPFTAPLGSSITASAVITNNTASAISLQGISFAGNNPGDYALDASNGCVPGAQVGPGAPCTLVVRFTPGDATARGAKVLLAYANAASPLSITLSGNGTPAPKGVLGSTAWSQAFDDTVVGSTSSKTITLSNTSSGPTGAPLTLASLDITGNASPDFQLAGDCNASTTLVQGAHCTLTLTFAPSAAGPRTASVQIASDASKPLASIDLAGNGLPAPVPALTFTSPAPNFGVQTVGGAYPSQSVTLTNSGTAALAISAVTVAGADFVVADASTCTGSSLARNTSCTVSVSFTPKSVQADIHGTLTITSNAPGSPATLQLVGTGTATQAPVLAWATVPDPQPFHDVVVGTVSPSQSFVLTNKGPSGATVTLVNAVGTGSSAFSIKYDTCSAKRPMYAGDSCQIDVAFAPASAGTQSATLQVVSNGSAPAAVALTGVGSGGPGRSLALSSTAMDFGVVQLGTRSQPAMLRLSNSGAGALQVAAIQATGAFSVQGASCPAAPFTLQSGAECSVAVVFQPSAAGGAAGTLSVQSDAQAQSGDVALAGKAEDAPDLSSGGCSVSRGGDGFDPTLWTLAALALTALAWRARERRRDARRAREARP